MPRGQAAKCGMKMRLCGAMGCYDAAMEQLDAFDRRLLALLQQDAGLTAEQLAEHVALSVSAIQRRIRRMRDRGVIMKDIALCLSLIHI